MPARPFAQCSTALPPPFHGDRADQMLVATARHHGAVVVTKDQRIRRYVHVQSIW
jgi:PIN domain nuclease of toxin-antitoxin system